MKFRKKPVVIEAVQYRGRKYRDEIIAFGADCLPENWMDRTDETLFVKTLEGGHIANPGDWIIKGVKGEFYPCKPDIFAATYEPAE
jgi:hypothetical protein